jgi:4-hydroxy-3-polyprenylbenzoate decarboxylase
MRLVVAISGASGSIFGVRLLEALRAAGGVETHLILSKWGQRTLEHETTLTVEAVRRLANVTWGPENMAAPLSSGSFRTDGMVVAPCSTKTLGAIANGISDSLIARAAEVTLKEGRRLVLLVRETPLSAIHLTNMLTLARLGVVILPPVPAFYNHPATLDDMIDHVVARVLDHFGIPFARARRWDGRLRAPAAARAERTPGADDAHGGER